MKFDWNSSGYICLRAGKKSFNIIHYRIKNLALMERVAIKLRMWLFFSRICIPFCLLLVQQNGAKTLLYARKQAPENRRDLSGRLYDYSNIRWPVRLDLQSASLPTPPSWSGCSFLGKKKSPRGDSNPTPRSEVWCAIHCATKASEQVAVIAQLGER